MQWNLSNEERDELLGIIGEHCDELRVEIRRTDSSEVKENLKKRQALVWDMRKRLEQVAA